LGDWREPLTLRASRRRSGRSYRLAYVFITPAVLVLLGLIVGPLVYSAVLSLYRWQLTQINTAKSYAGLANYRAMLHDGLLGTTVRNSVIFVVVAVSVELVLGILIATALTEITRGRQLATSLILLPMIVTPVVAALIWQYIYNPQFGTISQALTLFGHQNGLDVLGSAQLVLPGFMVIDIWQWTPFAILVFLAGMLSVPEELYEAARVDGAGKFRILRSITIPVLMPQILVVLLFRTMDAYRIFDTIYVLTKGGPGAASETVGLYAYQEGFTYFNTGYSMALGVFILVTVFIISSAYIRLLRRRQVF
jgi:multiple sugar transport system permease protein